MLSSEWSLNTAGKVPYLLGVLLTSLLFQLASKVSSCEIQCKIGTGKLLTQCHF